MNDFGLVQLIWIKRLVSETSRINTLIECHHLSECDVNRYKSVISSIDDFCAFVINSQNWNDVGNISKIVEEVEMVLFQHFYEQIDAFEDEKVNLDLSGDDEVNLIFENPFIENQAIPVIDDESYRNIARNDIDIAGKSDDGLFIDFEEFNGPIIEGDILPEEITFEVMDENSVLDIFDMKPGESREISVEDFIKILSQNQDGLSFTLNPEMFPDEADILSEDAEVSFEEFIAHLIDQNHTKGMGFGLIDDIMMIYLIKSDYLLLFCFFSFYLFS
ncbi:hypothetical protein [uncultured Methanobrevibacter sp.]|uniref:hypothetical protein n=1 Tax=uncultured Methanobrevibacter sp. TaxID=253161 RepID=UPI0025F24BB3|nr:hypothetical protein [uncultured Methanobrevibacter sp.]